jgi:hypothetical protein
VPSDLGRPQLSLTVVAHSPRMLIDAVAATRAGTKL